MYHPRALKSYIDRAEQIHAQLLRSYEETVQSIDKLKTDNSAVQLFLLQEANIYADDLNKVVFSLAQVTFKIDMPKHGRRDLQPIVNTLGNLAGAIRRSFSSDNATVKTELKNNIRSAVQEAERLLAVIRLDDMKEYKQEILNNQADILFSVDRVFLTNQIKISDPQQLREVAQNEVDKLKAVLLSFDPKDSNVIIQCTNHSLEKLQNCISYLNKAVTNDHFNGEVKNLLLDLTKIINKNVVDLHQIVIKNSNAEQLIEDIQKNMVESFGEVAKLIPLFTAKENDEDSGMELIVYAYSVGIGSIFQMRRNLEYAKIYN